MHIEKKIEDAFGSHRNGKLLAAEESGDMIPALQPKPPDEFYLAGLDAYRAGDALQAENLILEAIRRDSKNPAKPIYFDSLGDVQKSLGRPNSAITSYQMALQLNPHLAQTCFKLASTYHDLNNWSEAICYYRRAIDLQPDFLEAYYNAGLAHQAQHRPDDAIFFYRRALQLKPDFAEALNNLGTVYRGTGAFEKAHACFLEAIRLKPEFAEPYFNQGDLHYSRQDIDVAVKYFKRTLQLQPDMAAAHNNLGNAYKDRGEFDAAIASYRHVIRLSPRLAEGYYNLGSALRLQEKFDEAIGVFKQALQLKPDYAEAYNNLALCFKNQGLLEPALDHFNRALQIDPDLAEAHWNRSFTHLLRGDFLRGWVDYEWRFKQSRWKTIYPFRYDKPRWEGQPASNKTIFVHDEQGLGDTLQFARYLPLVKARCGKVILETRKSLMGLLSGFPGIDHLVERSTDGHPAVTFDYYVPLLSLPGIFKTTADDIPAQEPRLGADPGKSEFWRQRVQGSAGRLKVGIVWAGRPLHTNDRNRSCRLDQFSGLMEIPGVTLYGLQKGPAAEQANRPCVSHKFVNLGEEFDDFSDTAAAISCLDLVITVDTSVAHLAGAMAKPVWVLLPFIPDWRWMMDRTDSPWYPTMRLFRQKEIGAWDETFLRVAENLRRMASDAARA